MNRLLLIILMALAAVACVKQGPPAQYGAVVKNGAEVERMKVVYRYFSGEGQIEGRCKPGETIITVFCDRPNRYGKAIAPSSSKDSSQAVGTCSSTGNGTHRMILSCSTL